MNLVLSFLADVAVQPDERNARLAINIATFLTVLCWIFLVLFVISRFNTDLRKRFALSLGNNVYLLLFLVPTVAMGISLYFSEGLNWLPCRLCLYQRMCIYPLSGLMLLYAFWHKSWIRYVSFVLATLGPLISAYHISIEIKGEESSFCSAETSCATVWFKSFGFLTTPGMALSASVTVLALLYMSTQVKKYGDLQVVQENS